MCNLLVHEPILPPNHNLGKKFDCFFKHAGRNSSSDFWRTVCNLSSSNAMVDSSVKITRSKEINPRLRVSVWYEGNHHWLFLNSSQSILSNNFWLRKLTANVSNKFRHCIFDENSLEKHYQHQESYSIISFDLYQVPYFGPILWCPICCRLQPIDILQCFIFCVKRGFFLRMGDIRPCSRRRLLLVLLSTIIPSCANSMERFLHEALFFAMSPPWFFGQASVLFSSSVLIFPSLNWPSPFPIPDSFLQH